MEYSAAEVVNALIVDTGADRRQHARKRIKLNATLRTIKGDVLQGCTMDISNGGISVMLDKPLQAGTKCALSFSLFIHDRNVLVSGAGMVTACCCSGLEGFRIGMRFVISDPKIQQTVISFLGL